MLRVTDARELQAAVLAFKAAGRDLRRRINESTRTVLNEPWREAVSANLQRSNGLVTRLLSGGVRIAAGNPPRALAAQSTRGIGSTRRLTPAQDYALAEFGTGRREATSTYSRRSPAGRAHSVTRRTRRGLPARTPKGRAVYPAFKTIAPRAVALWVQIIVKRYSDAAEGK